MKKICLILMFFASVTPAYANRPYLLGQWGAYNQEDWQNFKYTGRIALGYEWDTALVLGRDADDLHFLCFNYGLELGYQYYQQNNLSYSEKDDNSTHHWDTNIHRQTVDILAVLDVTPYYFFDIFVKFGAAIITQKIDNTYEQLSTYEDLFQYSDANHDTRIVPKIMIGAGVNILDNMNINITYANEFKTNSIKSVAASPLKPVSSPISLTPPASSIMGGVKYCFW